MLDKLAGFQAGESLSDILQRHRGMGPGFDVLRIALAVLLFVGHAKWVAGVQSLGHLYAGIDPGTMQSAMGVEQWVGFTKPLKLSLVPAFFALSGFLVMGSAFRLRSTATFLAHRVLRIFPALVVEVLLSAFVLGAIFTTLPLGDYFTNPVFFRYFGNAMGWVTFNLPGVFETNPVKNIVNMNLWTLPSEFHCYIITGLLLLTKLIYDKKLFTGGFIIATVTLAVLHFLYHISAPFGPYPPHVIIYYFYVGVLFYHYKDKIPLYFPLFAACAVLTYVALAYDALVYVAPLALTYCTIFVGMIKFPKFKLLSSGDYSYGVYLYGFPISQAYIALFPGLAAHAVAFTALALATTCLFAVISWHVIEKRCLAFKKKLPAQFFPTSPR